MTIGSLALVVGEARRLAFAVLRVHSLSPANVSTPRPAARIIPTGFLQFGLRLPAPSPLESTFKLNSGGAPQERSPEPPVIEQIFQ